MADTGAPWNIPYVEPSDLVRNYPAAAEDLADAIAAGLTAAGNPGIGSNVVSTVKTDTFSASVTAGGTTTVTGLSASITPTSATSKILVFVDVSGSSNSDRGWAVIVERDGNPISVGAASGSRTSVTGGGIQYFVDVGMAQSTSILLDSPATTSAVTYTVDLLNCRAGTFIMYVNRTDNDSDINAAARSASRITVIEVAA